MTSTTRTRRATSILALIYFCAFFNIAHAADAAYPTRPIRLVVGFAPGGGTDVQSRILAPKLSDAMGQTWVVDNRGGAGGNFATEIVARANPDGHTVMLALDTQLTANPSLYKLSVDVERDLQAVTLISLSDLILVVHPSVQARTFKELVALAKQKPGALNYASAGTGTPVHLSAELLKKRAGIDIVHIPYKGGGPAAAAVLAGESQLMIGSAASTIQFVSAGRLRALASTGPRRSKLLPEVPTVDESGYPGFEVTLWYALFVPGGTPKSIVERIRNEVLKVMQQSDVQAAISRQGLDPVTSTPAELAARVKKESGVWAGIIKEARIRAD